MALANVVQVLLLYSNLMCSVDVYLYVCPILSVCGVGVGVGGRGKGYVIAIASEVVHRCRCSTL